MNKAYVYRLYPTADQKILFAKTFGCCRKIWNLMLGDRIDAYNDYGITLLPTPAWYKSDNRYSYLKEVDSLALANVQLDQQMSFTAFYNGTSGYPKFKSKRRAKLSYTTNNQGGTISVADKSVRLPKVGMVKARIHRKAPSYMKLKSATVSCDKCDRYYVSILYEYDRTDTGIADTVSEPEKILGLDYKSDGLYVDSEGRCADMPHFYRKARKKLKHLQRGLSRKVGSKKGEMPSHNFEKQLARIRKQHRHVADQRRDYLQKRSAALADEYDLIGTEDLSLKGMSSSRGLGLGKATNDNGFGMFVQMLAYKMTDRNKHLIKVGRAFPSSQLCQCGYKNPITKDLSVRRIICPMCGRTYDRDINAAINIRNEAYRIFRCGEQAKIYVGREPPELKPVELALTGYTFSGVCQLPPVLKQEARELVPEQFTEKVALKDTDIYHQTIIAVDLGINNACTCSAMCSDGTVLGRHFLKLSKEYDCLKHKTGRIKRAQRHGSRCVKNLWRYADGINHDISVKTASFIEGIARMYDADVIVFEHLDTSGKKHGSKKQKLALWRKMEVQRIATDKAHRLGMHIAHICAWGTSRLAYDGSGTALRGGKSTRTNGTYSICEFKSGKVYNCDLNASYNIGSRYFVRELLKSLPVTEGQRIQAKVPGCVKRSTCTLSTLISLNSALYA